MKRISARYLEMCRTSFPGADIKRLSSNSNDQLDLHTRLDLYLGEIAGYSSRPDQLHRRPRAELAKAQALLSSSFFDRHPQYAAYAHHLRPETTPDLHRELMLADKNRTDLLMLIAELLSTTGMPDDSRPLP